jgi:hypothetical protein
MFKRKSFAIVREHYRTFTIIPTLLVLITDYYTFNYAEINVSYHEKTIVSLVAAYFSCRQNRW